MAALLSSLVLGTLSSGGRPQSSGSAAAAQPNIVFVLADDLNADWKSDRLAYMPQLQKHFQQGGTEFVNHVAAVPVCGPSRSSLLLGRYPHNTRYLCNDDFGSVKAFTAEHNSTVGAWLRDAGYHTAFLGKYVNSVSSVPYGWSHWGGFISTYDFYNASRYDMDWSDDPAAPEPATTVRVMTGEHQAEFLPRLVRDNVRKARAKGKPFFIHTTPVMPHWGTCYGPQFPAGVTYNDTDPHWEFHLAPGTPGGPPPGSKVYAMPISPCPTVKNAHAFDGHTNPHIGGSYNTSNTGPRPAVRAQQEAQPLDAFQEAREDIGFRNRSASLIDLDDMLGAIMDSLEAEGVADSTYVIFSSDNGYHLGEHRMPFGKGMPYETDVRLPMYVRGPGVRPNATLPLPTTHLDITRTIVALAGAEAHAPLPHLDGLSFAAQLLADGRGEDWGGVNGWRNFSFSEYFCNEITWQYVRMIDEAGRGDDDDHAATGGRSPTTYTRWCEDNVTEVYDITPDGADPWQMHNLVGAAGANGVFAAGVDARVGPLADALGRCVGPACNEPVPSAQVEPLHCYTTVTAKNAFLGDWRFNSPDASGKPTALQGWAVDRELDDGSVPGMPIGFSPSTVRLRLDGRIIPGVKDMLANLTRTDLAKHPHVPNLEHGFMMPDIQTLLPAAAWTGKHAFDVVDVVDGGAKIHPLVSVNPPQFCLCDGKACPC